MKNTIFPHSLVKGDKIAIISPAGAVEEAQLSKTIALIKSKGYEPVFSENALGKFDNGYNYSGTEKQRLKDINWAFNNPEIKAIWASRGGYGCQHLLKKLKLKQFVHQPKWYIGYSDNTVVQSFLLKKGFLLPFLSLAHLLSIAFCLSDRCLPYIGALSPVLFLANSLR